VAQFARAFAVDERSVPAAQSRERAAEGAAPAARAASLGRQSHFRFDPSQLRAPPGAESAFGATQSIEPRGATESTAAPPAAESALDVGGA